MMKNKFLLLRNFDVTFSFADVLLLIRHSSHHIVLRALIVNNLEFKQIKSGKFYDIFNRNVICEKLKVR